MKNQSIITKKVTSLEPLESRIAPAFSGAVNLGALTGAAGFHIDGATAADQAGFSVADAGDVNHDGFADIVVGAPGVNGGDGKAYVIFGKATGIPLDFNLSGIQAKDGFQINSAAAGDHTGTSVAGAGDFNGDGIDDLIIGSPGASNGNGNAYVIFGRTSFTSSFNLSALSGNGDFGVKITAAQTGENLGAAVSGIGDFNGDGIDDVIIGAPHSNLGVPVDGGAGYVVFGRNVDAYNPNATSISAFQNLGAGFQIMAQGDGDHLGTSVSRAGDVNGDGFADLIIGAPNGTAFASADAGASWVLFGHGGISKSQVDLAALANGTGFKINGAGSGDQSSNSVHGVGDVNGDGFDDLIIGAATPSPGTGGESYLVLGKASFAANQNLFAPSTTFTGTAPEKAGVSVSGAGDFNGDGYKDLLISAPGATVNGATNAGTAYVVFGSAAGLPSSLSLASLNGAAGFHIDGVASADGLGQVVSAAGDVNGDGFDDILIGKPGVNADGKTNAGSTYLIYGSNGANNVTLSADHRVATYTDADGDLVTVKTNKGGFDVDDFSLTGANGLGGATLRHLDLTGHTDLPGAKITVTAKPQMIGGALHGDGLVNVGAFDADQINLGVVKINGDVGHFDASAVKSLTVNSIGALGLSTQGGQEANLQSVIGTLPSLTVKTSIEGALLAGSKIGTVKVGGDISNTSLLAVNSLKSLVVGGDLDHSSILGGYTPLGANADAQIGKIVIKGNWEASTAVAGVLAGADGKFGTNDDKIATGGNDTIASRIASIVIGGQANGSLEPGGNFAIEAQQIGSLKIGPTKFTLAATGAADDLQLGTTSDFRLHEVA